MNGLIKNEAGEYLTPMQISLLLNALGKLVKVNNHYTFTLIVPPDDQMLALTIVASDFPDYLSEIEIYAMMSDTIFREYTTNYHSSKRLSGEV